MKTHPALYLVAAAAGLYALSKWNNKSAAVTLPAVPSAIAPTFRAPATPGQTAAVVGSPVPVFSAPAAAAATAPAAAVSDAPWGILTDTSGVAFDLGSIKDGKGMQIRPGVDAREQVYLWRLAHGLPTSRELPWG